MRNITGTKILIYVLILGAFLFASCDHVGLGSIVNTYVPTITLDDGEAEPGSFLSGDGSNGKNRIVLNVEQPFGMDYVYILVEYTDKETGELMSGHLRKRFDATQDPNTGLWFVDIDTSDMEDGTIKTWVVAVDITGKSTTSTDIVYRVKNMPPQIELTIPSVRGPQFDGEDIGPMTLTEFLELDPVIVGFDLMGLATDDLGMRMGYPKIMIWPATAFPEGVIPPESHRYGQWHTLVINNPKDGITAARFTWPMVQMVRDGFRKDANGVDTAFENWRLPKGHEQGEPFTSLTQGNYRFRIWTQDMNGTNNFYPDRADNVLGLSEVDENGVSQREAYSGYLSGHPNPYVQIKYVASEIPIVTIRTVDEYYNAVGNFTASMTISSTSDLANVRAWITNDDEEPTFTSIDYPVSRHGDTATWVLTITEEQAAAWRTPAGTALGLPLSETETTLFVNIEAIDVETKKSPDAYRNFRYDILPPEVAYDRPVVITETKFTGKMKGGEYSVFYPQEQPRWVTGRVTVGGTSKDSFGIREIYYHIGKIEGLNDNATHEQRIAEYEKASNWTNTYLHTANTPTAPNWGGSVFAWTYTYDFNGFKINNESLIQNHTDLIGITDNNFTNTTSERWNKRFYLPFFVKVVDAAGNFHISEYKLCIDPELDYPLVSINYPTPDITMLGGEVRLSGTASDNNWMHSVQIRIKKYGSGAAFPLSDANGSFRYYIPTTVPPVVQPYVVNPSFPTWDDINTAEEKAGWFNANKLSDDMVIGWFSNINTNGGLNPEGTDTTVRVIIQIRAVDTKATVNRQDYPDLVGPTEELDIEFSTGVPVISMPVIKKAGFDDKPYPPTGEISSSGIFTISIVVGDDERIDFLRTRINGLPYILISPGATEPVVTNHPTAGVTLASHHVLNSEVGRYESTISILVDTVNNPLYSGEFGYGKTGYLNIEIEVEDNSTPTYKARSAYTVGIDNFYPTTTIETQYNASNNVINPATPRGRHFVLSGEAKDNGTGSGPIFDLARILVYFEEADIYYSNPDNPATRQVMPTNVFLNPRGKKVSDSDDFYNPGVPLAGYDKTVYASSGVNWSVIPGMDTYPNVRRENDPDGFGAPFANFPLLKPINKGGNIGTVWESPHAMVIDSPEFAEDIDRDGTFGEVWSGLIDKTWQSWMDTENFKDGPYYVHYIVMDNAGNATHYRRDMYIENNKPEITNINMGTSLFGDDTVASWTSSANPGEFMREHQVIGKTIEGNRILTFPSFRVRNNKLAFRLQTEAESNGAKKYKISYVTPRDIVSAGLMERGHVYTIVTSGATDWERYGAPSNAPQTTFVASGPAEVIAGTTAGTVLRYNEVITKQDVFGSGVHMLPNILAFEGDDFGAGENKIADSTGSSTSRPGWPLAQFNVPAASWPERFFMIKVYDSTVTSAGATEYDQLSHAVIVGINVTNTDNDDPKIDVAPFGREYVYASTIENPATRLIDINPGSIPIGENEYVYNQNNLITAPGYEYDQTNHTVYMANYNKNIVMSGSARRGYVEYSPTAYVPTTGAGTANISGKVIFTGIATDDQRISEIRAQITGYNGGTPFVIARWNPDSRRIEPHNGTSYNVNTIAALAPDAATNQWGFEVITERLTLDYGHVVYWRFAWDSATHADVVADNVRVEFRVSDSRTPTPLNTANSNQLTVNVRSYISEVETALAGAYRSAPSAFARSSTGWYPIRENEVITIRGFNLGRLAGDGITAVTPSVRINGTALAAGVTLDSKYQIRANVGTGSSSGALDVRIGTTLDSFNNSSNINLRYNQEPNNTNNNILTNRRNLYIWQTGHLVDQRIMASPFMRMRPSNGDRIMSYAMYEGAGYLYVRSNGGGGNNDRRETYTNRYLNTTVAIDGNGAWYAMSSNMTANASSSITFYARATATGNNITLGDNKRILFFIRNNLGGVDVYDENRARIPRIFAQSTGATNTNANATRIFMSYNDANSTDKPVLFQYGLVGANNQFGGNLLTNNQAITRHPRAQVVASESTATYKGSMFTAVGALSNGLPVIAWFDPSNGGRLVFSYGGAGTEAPRNGTALWEGVARYTTTDNATETVYNAAAHGLAASNTDINRALVYSGDNAPGTGYNAGTNLRHIRRVINTGKFVINAGNGAAANIGTDSGATISVIPALAPTLQSNNTTFTPVTGTTITTNVYRLATGHGLTGINAGTGTAGATVWVWGTITSVNANPQLHLCRVQQLQTNGTDVRLILNSATSNAALGNVGNYVSSTAATTRIYLPNRRLTATSSTERYYTTVVGFSQGDTVNINAANYNVIEVFPNNGLDHFKLATGTTMVNLGAGNVIVNGNRADNIVTTETQQWQNNGRIVARNGLGTHVDLVVDGNDNVHLAFYNSIDGGLWYARIPASNPNAINAVPNPGNHQGEAGSNIELVRVDTFLAAGMKLMLNVREDSTGKFVPYISYYHNSFGGTKNSIRVAWLRPDASGNMTVRAGANDEDMFTGAWEVMTVPVLNLPLADEFICHGVPRSTTWTTTGTGLSHNANMNRTMLVGYMTDMNYEGAILKHVIPAP